MDIFIEQLENSEIQIQNIITEINLLLKKEENKKKDIEYIKIHQTDKSGMFLVTTKKRAELLKKLDKNNKFQIRKMLSNNQYAIENNSINKLCETCFKRKNELKNIIEKYYYETLEKLECFHEDFINISKFISSVDILQNKCYISKKYNYSKPIISSNRFRFKIYIDLL